MNLNETYIGNWTLSYVAYQVNHSLVLASVHLFILPSILPREYYIHCEFSNSRRLTKAVYVYVFDQNVHLLPFPLQHHIARINTGMSMNLMWIVVVLLVQQDVVATRSVYQAQIV